MFLKTPVEYTYRLDVMRSTYIYLSKCVVYLLEQITNAILKAGIW